MKTENRKMTGKADAERPPFLQAYMRRREPGKDQATQGRSWVCLRTRKGPLWLVK